ncbi:MAG: hypothetical protein EOO77_16095 [Oxalobacteraceae bacterium]|nr:MAG: hypothetical protein EOO77_16095 [Oxalobacteraceae bacterium]
MDDLKAAFLVLRDSLLQMSEDSLNDDRVLRNAYDFVMREEAPPAYLVAELGSTMSEMDF